MFRRTAIALGVLFLMQPFVSRADFPPENPVYFVTGTMPGQNPDEIIAAIQAANGARGRLLGFDTTTAFPRLGAKLLKFILDQRGFTGLPVYPGIGPENNRDFKAFYPRYPFGDVPYQKWGDPYLKRFGSQIEEVVLPSQSAGEAIYEAALKYPGQLVLIATGPVSNVADAIRLATERGRLQDFVKGVSAIVVAGSWLKTDGDRLRLSFNLVMDLQASDDVFRALTGKIHLVDSTLIRDQQLKLGPEQLANLRAYTGPDTFVTALKEDVENWLEATKSEELNIMDPLAVLAAMVPEGNLSKPVGLVFNPNADRSIHMNHPEAPSLFAGSPDESIGQAQLIYGFRQPDFVRTPILNSVLRLSAPRWFARSPTDPEPGHQPDHLLAHLLKEDRVVILDTDAWFDPDDLFALGVAMRFYSERVAGVVTNLWDPLAKATMTRLMLDELGFPAMPVIPGLGIYRPEVATTDPMGRFEKMYPYWPTRIFGAPYPNQGKAMADVYKPEELRLAQQRVLQQMPNGNRTDGSAAVDFIVETAKRYPGRLTIVSLSPMNNIAAALERYPELKDVATVVAMGGWMDDENGKPARLGYNTVLGLSAAKKVLESGMPVILVNSETVKGLYLDNKSEMPLITQVDVPSKLSKMLVGEIRNWETHAKSTMKNVQFADPVTVVLAGSPHLIRRMEPVDLQLFEGSGTMFDNAKNLFSARNYRGVRPNVFVVRELHQEPAIKQMIGSTILGMTNPGLFASDSSCRDILSGRATLDGDTLIRRLIHDEIARP